MILLHILNMLVVCVCFCFYSILFLRSFHVAVFPFSFSVVAATEPSAIYAFVMSFLSTNSSAGTLLQLYFYQQCGFGR